ncbi:autotransporter adhesin [Paraburkholderia sp. BL8N3]|nr:YadA-like family protein [Paraburkholderia sp. BL8N3]TCK33733.1 autotransporter adhesin [Paraburkholderia sp. BL8N3]
MNTVYRSVWNAVTRTFVAAAETTKRTGKGRNLRRAATVVAMAAGVVLGGATGEVLAASTNITLGSGADASGEGATAVGYGSDAKGKWAVAFGPRAQALNEAVVALGAYSQATAVNSVALGANANAKAVGSVALGERSVASENYTVSVGNSTQTRRITNVADGIATQDAATMGQLDTTRAQVTNNATSISGIGTRVGQVESGVASVNGRVTTISQDIATIQGQVGNAVVYDSAARKSVTLGAGSATGTVKLKNLADGVANTDAVNMGQLDTTRSQVTTNARNIDGLGTRMSDVESGVSSVNGRVTTHSQEINTLKDQMGNAVAYDSVARDSVTLGGASTNAVQLKNVAEGVANNDAANMGQLNTTRAQVATNATNIDGLGTRVGEVESGVSSVNSRVTTNTQNISSLVTKMDGVVMYDSPARNTVTLGGAAGTGAVQLKNVADGGVSTNSTDAVNGSQLNATNTRVDGNTAAISNLSGDIANGSVGLVQQNGSSRTITVGMNTDGDAVNISGTSGARQLTGVKDGTVAAGSSSAVNGSQLHGVSTSVANALGGGSTVNADGTISAPAYTAGGVTHNTVSGAVMNLDGRVSANSNAITGLQSDVGNAVMYDSAVRDRITLGGQSASGAVQVSNLADGDVSETSKDAVNGSQLHATNVKVDRNTSDIASLNSNIAEGNIGLTRQDTVNRNITVGKSTDGTVVDFSGTLGARQLYGVSNGTVASGSLYAINGGQLHSTSNSVAQALGGGSIVNGDGTIAAPSYSVGGKSFNNVGGAITNLDGRVATIESTVTNVAGQIESGQIGLVKQDSSTGKISVAADKGGSHVDMNGTDGNRTVTGVADGSIASGSSDVVNGGQIYSLTQEIGLLNNGLSIHSNTIAQSAVQANTYTDQQVNKAIQNSMGYTDRKVNTVRRDANAGTAAAMAMAQLPQSVKYGTGMVSVGGATYDGESAVAVGLSTMTSGGRWVFKGSASANTRGNYGVGVGAGMHF